MRSLLLAALLFTAAAAPDAPQLPQDARPAVEHPYDTQADAHAAVDAAFAAARRTGHLVLLDFGGNWCLDCRLVAGVLTDPRVAPWAARHFEIVAIDLGRFTKNTDIAARFGVKLSAAPTVLVLTPDGRLLNRDSVFALSDARHISAQAAVDQLAAWAAQDQKS